MSEQSNSCFSLAAPVFRLMNGSLRHRLLRVYGDGLQHGVQHFARLDRRDGVRRPVEAADLHLLQLPASFNAAIAPSAISSLPLITPMMSGWACNISPILSCLPSDPTRPPAQRPS